MSRLAGKIALVTGAARGIGAAIVARFRAEGATVLANDVAAGPERLVADVADPAAVAAMFAEVRRRHGRLDVLVNNAGISGLEAQPETAAALANAVHAQIAERTATGAVTTHLDVTVNTPDDLWRRTMAVHVDGTFFCSREALKLMNERNSGVILNLGSIMGTSGGVGAPAYCAAKAAILGFTRALAREVATRNIRVNAIAPGWIDTDMTAPLAPLKPLFAMQTPLGRFGDVDDIAWAAVYLASEEAKFVTGQVLSPNGGWHMSQ